MPEGDAADPQSSPGQPAPSTNPREWEAYLKRYFAAGVRFIPAGNEGAYEEAQRFLFVLSDGVKVYRADDGSADLAIWELVEYRDHVLRNVREMSQQVLGLLFVKSQDGSFAWLDSRLTDCERAKIAELVEWNYGFPSDQDD